MGEYAEMALDGTMCEGCGEYLGNGPGFPRYCSACQAANRETKRKPNEDFSGREMPLGAKLLKTLERVRTATDYTGGGYPGCHADESPAQFRRLRTRGMIENFIPHNPVHKERVVITDKGRDALGGDRGSDER